MEWVKRTIVLPSAIAEAARAACVTVAGSGAESMYTTKLSADGTAPATHAISAGHVAKEFADLLPVTGVSAGDAAALAALTTGTDNELSEAEVQALLDVCHISVDKPKPVLAALGLEIIV